VPPSREAVCVGCRALILQEEGAELLEAKRLTPLALITRSTEPDNKKIVGKPDSSRVSAEEGYEIRDPAKKFGMPPPLVKNVITQNGPMPRDVKKYLAKMKAAKEK
jgi:hypothetical protein